mgnify:CR=1 FL=1
MSKVSVRQYALALLELSSESATMDKIVEELRQISELINENKNFKDFLFNPEEKLSKKKELLAKEFGNSCSSIVQNTLIVLVANGDLDELDNIASYLKKLIEDRRGIMEVKVISSIILTADQQQRIKEKLIQATNKEIILKTEIDPGILGGMVIKTDNELIDASVKGKLQALRMALSKINK